tara:strand:- start:365 stop:595 length:231 start_codon:yes stop_codon:yes gene_type:complete
MTKSKRELLNKDKDLSTILDYSVDILFHIKTIKRFVAEEEELDELISEDLEEIKVINSEIFDLALKIRNENEEKFK